MKTFPKGFLWGSAMSAPQTEGHSLQNGKSKTTWDYWYEIAPEVFQVNQGPENTSNLYELYEGDCKRMKEVGLNSIRTSISWARLLPDGKTLNQEAVAFYRDYFQKIKKQGIEPIINLFHFDMPMWLMEKGGWETRESVDAFAFYAKTAFEQFGDLIKTWTTFNEPIVHVECGYLGHYHYPAIVDFKKAVQVAYHTVMAHTYAVKAFKEMMPDGKIGIILNITPAYAKSDSNEDLKAKEASDLLDAKSFLDPAVKGEFPKALVDLLETHHLLPTTQSQDKKVMKENTVDFIGINYYQPKRVQAPVDPHFPAITREDLYAPYDWPEKRINPYRGWEIYPEALYDVAMMMKNEYNNIPWYVSENGMGVAQEERFMGENGVIQDDYRIDFMKEHLDYLYKGIQEGSNCFGYHTWTFMDNWSWLNGYKNRYGFYRVDLEDGKFTRTMKKSGTWFKQIAENNGY